MNRAHLREKLHLSGIDSAAAQLARRYALGFEVTAFCMAAALEDSAAVLRKRKRRILPACGSTRPLPSCIPAPSTRWCGTLRHNATARPSP